MISKLQLKIPFRQRDLITVSEFISYCKEYGIDTDEQELEFYEKEQLLLPAIRVMLGYVPMRRVLIRTEEKDEWQLIDEKDLSAKVYKEIDPTIYYSNGSLIRTKIDKKNSLTKDGWLDWYVNQKNGVLIPAEQKFRLWKDYSKGGWMETDLNKFDDNYIPLYIPLQIYPLRFIQQHFRVTIKDAALTGSDEEWVKRGRTIHEKFFGEIKDTFVRKRVVEQLKLIGLVNDIKELTEKINLEVSEYYNRQLDIHKKIMDIQEAKEEARLDTLHSRRIKSLKEKTKKTANKLLKQHNLSSDELRDWLLDVLSLGTFGLGSHKKALRKQYLYKLNDDDLIKSEDPYKLAAIINSFLELFDKKQPSIRQLILETRYPICEICGKQYIPKINKKQLTCASKDCLKTYRNKYKREQRIKKILNILADGN